MGEKQGETALCVWPRIFRRGCTSGENVTAVQEGEYVSAETHIICGKCLPCLTGKEHVCRKTLILGVDTDGCFAEYVKVPAANI